MNASSKQPHASSNVKPTHTNETNSKHSNAPLKLVSPNASSSIRLERARKKYDRHSSLRMALAAKSGQLALVGELVITALDDIDTFLQAKNNPTVVHNSKHYRTLKERAEDAIEWLRGASVPYGYTAEQCAAYIDNGLGTDSNCIEQFVNRVIAVADQ